MTNEPQTIFQKIFRYFGTDAIEATEGKKPVKMLSEVDNPPLAQNFYGRQFKNRAAAEKTIKNAVFSIVVIVVFSFLEGLGNPLAFILVAILGVIGFLLQKHHNRGAAIAMLSIGIIDLISRIATGNYGALIPLIMIYYGYRSIQATFAWHNFEKHDAPATPVASTPPPPPPSPASSNLSQT